MAEDVGLDAVRLAIALRSGRSALGISQVDCAQQIGVSKSTLARAETGEGVLPSDALMRALRFFNENGVKVQLLEAHGLTLEVTEAAVRHVYDRFSDTSVGRSDRRPGTQRRVAQRQGLATIPNALEPKKSGDD
jgi:DNA-binding XRE family transcriptional regulator